MEPTHIFYIELEIDENNSKENISKEIEVENVILKKKGICYNWINN